MPEQGTAKGGPWKSLRYEVLTIGNVNNKMLNKNRLFLRVYKLKDKFRYLIKENPEKKTVLREIFSFII